MIVLTNPSIKNVELKRKSSTVKYAGEEYCLAEVPDDFECDENDLQHHDISFWYELGLGYIDSEQWNYEAKFKGGMIEGAEWVYSLSKERNIALVIYEVSNLGIDPFELWEKTIKK